MSDRHKFRVFDKNYNDYLPEGVLLDGRTGDIAGTKYDGYIIEQCTGLRDKNGKLIFEGDWVRYYRSTAMGLGGERIASVKWDDRCGAWYILTTLGDGYDMYDALNFGIEIIGNIHEVEKEK